MRICVVSDMHFKYHIGSDEDQNTNDAVLSFFGSIRGEYDLLVLNGDIFDLWFDWKYGLIKQYFPVLKSLADIREAGCRIVYISGNHDFWFNDFFPHTMQIELYPDSFEIIADEKKMLFTHGDLYTVNDMRYKIFRSFIRLGFMKNIFSKLHPDFALWIGTRMSRSSRKRKMPPSLRARKTAGLRSYATKMLDAGFNIVVMGHSHEPEQSQIGRGVYANCGDWIKHKTYINIIDGKVGLCKFEQQS